MRTVISMSLLLLVACPKGEAPPRPQEKPGAQGYTGRSDRIEASQAAPDEKARRAAALIAEIAAAPPPANEVYQDCQWMAPDAWAIGNTALVLRRIGAPAKGPVREAWAKAQGPARRWLGIALAELGDPAPAAEVRPLLEDPDPIVRMHAASALGRAGDRESIPALKKLLADPFQAPVCAFPSGERSGAGPVAGAAAGALYRMGITLTPRPDGTFEALP